MYKYFTYNKTEAENNIDKCKDAFINKIISKNLFDKSFIKFISDKKNITVKIKWETIACVNFKNLSIETEYFTDEEYISSYYSINIDSNGYGSATENFESHPYSQSHLEIIDFKNKSIYSQNCPKSIPFANMFQVNNVPNYAISTFAYKKYSCENLLLLEILSEKNLQIFKSNVTKLLPADVNNIKLIKFDSFTISDIMLYIIPIYTIEINYKGIKYITENITLDKNNEFVFNIIASSGLYNKTQQFLYNILNFNNCIFKSIALDASIGSILLVILSIYCAVTTSLETQNYIRDFYNLIRSSLDLTLISSDKHVLFCGFTLPIILLKFLVYGILSILTPEIPTCQFLTTNLYLKISITQTVLLIIEIAFFILFWFYPVFFAVF